MILLDRSIPSRLQRRAGALASALALLALVLFGASQAHAEQEFLERPPAAALEGAVPSNRILGEPGAMRIASSSCPVQPLDTARRRIVDLAAQEWAYFGFSVTDRAQANDRDDDTDSRNSAAPILRLNAWRRVARDLSRMRGPEFARIAPSIAGYWAVTPDGAMMLERQNAIWNRSNGVGSRWRDPWSAAFVSWVMCEAGIGDSDRFQRSIAHREYIDQAIRSRDGAAPNSAFVAYDIGEAEIVPGDLLCSGTRSGYRTIDHRRRQMGRGASTHCDVVVSVDETDEIILAIGGNVSRSVSMKRLPAVREPGVHFHPSGHFFAHLQLKSDGIAVDALTGSPTMRAMACTKGFDPPSRLDVLALNLESDAC